MKMIWVGVLTAVGIVCINVDECSSNPCENGGKCSCVTGFFGDTCENIDECSSNPCENGATCIDGDNKYTCSCAAGFNGDNCETNIDDCSSNPCANNYICDDGVNNYTCHCPSGFGGYTCEQPYVYVRSPVGLCHSDPIFHSLTGASVDNCKAWCNYNSTCAAFEFTNNTCHFSSIDCKDRLFSATSTYYKKSASYHYSVSKKSNCFPGKFRFVNLGQAEGHLDGCKYHCDRDSNCGGFHSTGAFCYLKNKNCKDNIVNDTLGRLYVKEGTGICVHTNPCKNGGACIRVGNNYTCSCAYGFNGSHCETEQPTDIECSSNPCKNDDDICVDGYKKYTCWCPIGSIRAETRGVSCKKRSNKFSISSDKDCLLGKSIGSMKPTILYDPPNCKHWCYNKYTCGGFVIDLSPNIPNVNRTCLFKSSDCRNDIQDVFYPHHSHLYIIAN